MVIRAITFDLNQNSIRLAVGGTFWSLLPLVTKEFDQLLSR